MFRLVKTECYDMNNLVIENDRIQMIVQTCIPTQKGPVVSIEIIKDFTEVEPPFYELYFYAKRMDKITSLPPITMDNKYNVYLLTDSGLKNNHVLDKILSFQRIEFQNKQLESFYDGDDNELPLQQNSLYVRDINNSEDVKIYPFPTFTGILYNISALVWDQKLLFIFNIHPSFICGYYEDNKFIEIMTTTSKDVHLNGMSVFAVLNDKLLYLDDNGYVKNLEGKIVFEPKYSRIHSLDNFLLSSNSKKPNKMDIYNSSFQFVYSFILTSTNITVGFNKMYVQYQNNIIDCHQMIEIKIDNYSKFPLSTKQEIIKLIWINRKYNYVLCKDLLNLVLYYLI